jgi:hypothetical protein
MMVIVIIKEARFFGQRTEHQFEVPAYLSKFFRVLTEAIAYTVNHLASVTGWYIAFLGILLSLTEIWASQRQYDVRALCQQTMRNSGRTLFPALLVVALIWLFLIIFFLPGRISRRAFISRYAQTHPNASSLDYIQAGLTFEWAHVSHIVSVGAVVVFSLALAIVAWSFGFWGTLVGLMKVSKSAAEMMRLKAYVPIASIILGIAGIALASAQ